jgi:hypothetical protein
MDICYIAMLMKKKKIYISIGIAIRPERCYFEHIIISSIMLGSLYQFCATRVNLGYLRLQHLEVFRHQTLYHISASTAKPLVTIV